MATRFPSAGIDDSSTLPNPNTTDKTNSPSLAGQQGNQNDAIKAIETKLGTGTSTPVANTFLLGTGTGTSAWSAVTSAQLISAVSDETGTGSLVFNSTPTLITPKVDTINESTLNNGVTVGGVNIRSGALTTSNSVVTTNITNASVTANKLATGASSATVNTSETTTSGSYVSLATATDSVTVIIGANGLALVTIGCWMSCSLASGNAVRMSFAASGANTIGAGTAPYNIVYQTWTTNAFNEGGRTWLITGLTPGSTTFAAKYLTDSGTGTFKERNIAVVPL